MGEIGLGDMMETFLLALALTGLYMIGVISGIVGVYIMAGDDREIVEILDRRYRGRHG